MIMTALKIDFALAVIILKQDCGLLFMLKQQIVDVSAVPLYPLTTYTFDKLVVS